MTIKKDKDEGILKDCPDIADDQTCNRSFSDETCNGCK